VTSYGRRVRSSRCCSENRNKKISNITTAPRCPCGQCTKKRLRRAHADVTSYGQAYDRRDVVSKTEIRKFKYYNCPRCPCGQCTRKRLRRAHAVDYRRHERWWATPVVKSSKLVVSSMELTKRVAGFVVFLISFMVLPWALKTRTSKSHVAMRANEPATLLAEACASLPSRMLCHSALQSRATGW